MLDTIVHVELACWRIQTFNAVNLFKRLGIKDNDFTIGLEAICPIPYRDPYLRTIVIELNMNGCVALRLGQANRLDNLTALFGDNLNRLLNLWLWVFGLVCPYIVRVGMCTQEYTGAICLNLIADFPCLAGMTLWIITPNGNLANTEVNRTADRATLGIVPVGTRAGMGLFVGIDHRLKFLRHTVDDNHLVMGNPQKKEPDVLYQEAGLEVGAVLKGLNTHIDNYEKIFLEETNKYTNDWWRQSPFRQIHQFCCVTLCLATIASVRHQY